MKINHAISFILIVSICVFGVSCQGTQKSDKGQKTSVQDKGIKDHETEEEEEEIVYNFDKDEEGALPRGWTSSKTGKGGLGKWVVVNDETAPSKHHVLAQISKENLGYHFSVTVIDNTNYSDLEIELKFKAVDGQEDQGGGPVWRYSNADNYYICRANPLESNFRVYKVVDGNRRQLQSADVDIPSNIWHTMEVEQVGDHIKCWLNDKLYLDVKDDTFKEGKVGLWTKADAVTYFDDLEIETED